MMNTSRLLKTGLAVITIAALLAGCGANKGQQKMAISVNTYKLTAEDTPVTAEYSGMVIATDKVPVQAKISGRVFVVNQLADYSEIGE